MRDERNEEQIDTSSLLSSERPIADKRKRGPIRSDTPSVIYAVAGGKKKGWSKTERDVESKVKRLADF